ncbi:arylamine N-acetyltransferase [Leucothrix sargassi]|nr:arylamine N-acetyltransferase [Leucothrix sargassi]
MTSDHFVLENYFKRIGYNGDNFKHDAASLKELMQCQLFSIPFENLDVLSGKGISLEAEDIIEKTVNNSRGGYCYELNGLFAMALTALGISYKFVAARPMFYPVKRPRTHMVIIAELENRSWLIDLGFGSYGIREPIALDQLDQTLEQGYDRFQLSVLENNDYLVSAMVNGEWTKQFAFENHAAEWIDFVPANFLNSNHPDAIFVQKPVLISHNETGRQILLGDRLKVIDKGTVTEETIPAERFDATLKELFRIEVSA